jgi:hypothetical protein
VVRRFIREFWRDWVSLVSGPLSVLLAALGGLVGERWLSSLFWIGAFACSWLTAYRLWLRGILALDLESAALALRRTIADGEGHLRIMMQPHQERPITAVTDANAWLDEADDVVSTHRADRVEHVRIPSDFALNLTAQVEFKLARLRELLDALTQARP